MPLITAPRAALLYLALALLFLAPALAPGAQLGGVDYSGAAYPVLEFVDRVFASGRVPAWIPGVMGGVPVFANPGGTFHPVRLLLAQLLPSGMVFAAFVALHFALAGLGTYLLLRELGVRRWVALVGGVAFEFAGPLASLLYAGHDGRFIVAASAPLVLWGVHRGVRTGAVAPFAVVAAAVGCALLGFQLQSVYYLLLLTLAWAAYALAAHGHLRAPGALGRRLALGAGAAAVALALAAVALLPFVDYVAASPRGGAVARGYAFATSYSMPPQETLGLAVPEQAGALDAYRGPNPLKLHTEYAGALVLVLAALGLGVARRDGRWRFFAAAALVALTVAWGGYTPVYRLYYAVLPGTTKFRAPGIALYVVALALVLAAALALERLAELRDGGDAVRLVRVRRATERLVAGGVVFAAGLGVAQRLDGPTAAAGAGWIRFALCVAAVGLALALWLRRALGTRWAAAALVAVTVADLWIVDRRFLLVMDDPGRLYAADDVVDFLRAQPDLGRVWVFPRPAADGRGYRGNGVFGVRSNYLLHFGIPQAGGEHGNQLQRWNEYAGTGGSLRPLDWHNLIAWAPMRDAAAVRYVVSRVDLARTRDSAGVVRASGLRPVFTGEDATVVYRNDRALPRAYLVPAVEVAPGAAGLAAMQRDTWDPRQTAMVEAPLPQPLPGGPLRGNVAMIADAADSAVVWTAADRAALLVVADNYYPGWTATVDGRPSPVLRANHTFRGVVVGPGAHEVRFHFRPADLARGFRVSVATLLLLAAYAAAAGARRLRRALRRRAAHR